MLRILTCLVVLLAACRPAPVAIVAPASTLTPAAPPATRPNRYEAVELNGVYTVRRTDINWVSPRDFTTCSEAQALAAKLWFYTTNMGDLDEQQRAAQRAQMPWVPCAGGGQ